MFDKSINICYSIIPILFIKEFVMRKITNKILFLVISLITLYLCGCENPTIYEEKTIIVNKDGRENEEGIRT